MKISTSAYYKEVEKDLLTIANITGLSNAVYRKGAVDLIAIWRMLKISCHTISGVL